MLKKTIKYNDYNGNEREEDFYFNLSKAEVTEMELSVNGGLAEQIQNVINAKDTPTIIQIFKDLVLKAYGEKSIDGKRFRKVDDNKIPLCIAFSETEAYSNLFMELATNATAATEFVNGIVPADLDKEKMKTASVDSKLAEQLTESK